MTREKHHQEGHKQDMMHMDMKTRPMFSIATEPTEQQPCKSFSWKMVRGGACKWGSRAKLNEAPADMGTSR